MALIKCPECGKEISNRADACLHCGCPIGNGRDGVLRVTCRSTQWLGSCSIGVKLDGGATYYIRSGHYYDLSVPADGKKHYASISCSKGMKSETFSVTLNPGESKSVTIWYDNSGLFAKWKYREEMIVTK